MKRILLIATALSVLATGAAYAQKKNRADSSGCGVGTILFEGQVGIFPQVGAITTNGSFGNQTFGVSSGTLGCNTDGVVTPPTNVKMFTVANLDGLSRDIARGEGERLASLAELMGIAEQHRATFFRVAQGNYATIFPSENVTSEQFLASLNQVMAADPILRRYIQA